MLIEIILDVKNIDECDNLELILYRREVKLFRDKAKQALAKSKEELVLVDTILLGRLKDLEIREDKAKDDREEGIGHFMSVH